MKPAAMLLGCFLLISAIPCGVANALTLYDKFQMGAIDPTKWVANEQNNNTGLSRECVREIHSTGALRLGHHAYGLITGSTAATSAGQRLTMIDPSNVTTMQCTITMTKDLAVGSGSAADPAQARAGIGGSWFNTGNSSQGGLSGDVYAEVRLSKKSTSGGIAVYGTVYECADNQCVAYNPIGTVQLGTVNFHQKANVSVHWDQANHQFIFQYIISKKNTQTQFVPYSVLDAAPPSINSKRLRLDAVVPPCTQAPCTEAAAEAWFGPVYINR